jgi:WD40 repeat protein/Flp pilus assembly protein TadD
MTPPDSGRMSIGQLVAEWRALVRRGERPDVNDYAARYPDLADQIRRLFPTVVVIEDLKAEAADLTGTASTGAGRAPALRLERLGDFRILREVGRGGMGVVYEAEQESLGRRVALKVLPAGAMLDPRHPRRFQREAKAAARLHHTNIVPVFGVGEQDGVLYYVMQFIQGLGLDKVLAELRRLRQVRPGVETVAASGPPPPDGAGELSAADVARSLFAGPAAAPPPEPSPEADRSPGSLPHEVSPAAGAPAGTLPPGALGLARPGATYWRSVARMGIQVAEALEHAASQGILHRDIKPSNLLLDTHGTVWVTDFGLAKAAAVDGEDLTHTGDIVGTLRYMAPERFDGRSDVRSDLYSLGLTLYELLVQQPAFGETDRSKLIHQVTTQEPVRPRKIDPAIPRDLETIVLKTIARDPAHRYAQPADLASDLQRFLEDRPIQARRTGPAERLARWCRRNPRVAGLTATVAFLLLGVAAVSVVAALYIAAARTQADRNAANERLARADAEKAQKQAEASAEESHRTLARLHVANGAQLLNDGDLFGSLVWFAEALRRDAGNTLWEDVHRQRLGTVWAQCPKLLQVWAPEKVITLAELSPNGRRVLIAGAATADDPAAKHFVHVYDLETSAAVVPPLEMAGRVSQAAFSPDSRRLLTVSSVSATRTLRWETRVWDLATGKLAFPPLQDTGDVYQASFSPDGRRLVTMRREGGVGEARLWDAATGKPVTPPLRHSGQVLEATFNSDGGRLLTVSNSGPSRSELRAWDAETGAPAGPPLQLSGAWTLALFSPDGGRVATGGHPDPRYTDGGAQVWDVVTGKPISPPLKHGPSISYIAFNADGRRLLTTSGDGTAAVWDATTGASITLPPQQARWVNRAVYDPAGHALLTTSGDGMARVWDTIAGEALTPPLAHRDLVTRAVFGPDGHRVLTVSANEVRLWDLARGLAGTGLVAPQVTGAKRVVFSPDGRRLLAFGAQQLRVWDVTTGEPVSPPLSLPEGNLFPEFSPDGRRLLMSTKGPDKWETRVLDVASGQLVFPPLEHPGYLGAVLFSADAQRVLTESLKDQVWDAGTGKPIGPPLNTSASALALSPDGRRAVLAFGEGPTGEGSVARVWDMTTAEPVSPRLKHKSEIIAASFSADGRSVVTASEDQTARVWDAASGEPVCPPLRHAGQVNSATFSRDGSRVVTASDDWSARVWNATTGEPVTPPLKHRGAVQHASFSPDGRRVVTAGDDSTALVWDATTGEPLAPPLKHAGKVSRVSFTPDGRRVIAQFQVSDASGTDLARERLWELATTHRPVQDLVRQAQLQTSQRMAPNGSTLVPLDQDAVRQDWQALRARYPEDCSSSPAEVLAWHRRQVEACQGAQDWFAVVFHLDRLLAAEPADGTLYLLRAQARDERGEWQKAVADYSRTIDREAGNAEAWQGRGLAHFNLGDWDRARADFARTLELVPEDGAVWLAQSLAHAKLGQEDKAETDFAKAAEHAPTPRVKPNALWEDRTKSAPSNYRLWQGLLKTSTRAIDAFPAFGARTVGLLGSPSGQGPLLAASALCPGRADVEPGTMAARLWGGRGLAQAAARAWQPAAEDLSTVLNLKNDGQAWLGRGRARMELGQWEPALADLTRATELRPDDGSLWYLRAIVHDQLHRHQQVLEDCSKAIERKSDGWAVRVYRGYASGELRQNDRSAADYARALKLGAAQYSFWGMEVALRVAAGDLSGYRKRCAEERAAVGGSPDPDTANTVAWTCTYAPDAVSDWAPVVDLSEKALAANPKDWNYLTTQGAVLYRAGRFDAAIERLGIAIKTYGERGTIWDWLFLAMAHSRLGHTDEARQWLAKSVQWLEQPDDVKTADYPDLFPLTWTRRLEIQILRGEAEALLKGNQ